MGKVCRLFFIISMCLTPQSKLFAQEIYTRVIGLHNVEEKGIIKETGNEKFLLGSIEGDALVVKLNEDLGFVWEYTYNVLGDDKAIDIVKLSTGDYVMTMLNDGVNMYSHVLLDQYGRVKFSKSAGIFDDRLPFLMATSDGGFLAYGELEGMLRPKNNTIAVIKYKNDLSIDWHYAYDYKNSESKTLSMEMYAGQAVEYPDGSIAILGVYTNYIAPGSVRNVRVIKIDPSGNVEWVKGFQAGKMDFPTSLVMTEDGNLMVGGFSNSFGDSGDDLFIAELSGSGDLLWIKTYSGPDVLRAWSMVIDQDGGFIMAGRRNYDAMLVKISSEGNFEWGRFFGDNREDEFEQVLLLDDGYLATGTTYSYDMFVKADIFVVKTDSTGFAGSCTQSFTLTSEEVSVTTFEGVYDLIPFALPASSTTGRSKPTLKYRAACSICPEGQNYYVELCNDEPYTLTVRLENSNAYSWSDGIRGLTRTFDREEHISITYLTDNDCRYEDHYYISEGAASMSLDLGPDRELCIGETILLEVDTSKADYVKWQDGSTGSSIEITMPGTYYVSMENTCKTLSDTLIVKGTNVESVQIPNVITPNKDGKNDTFIVDAQLEGSSISIRNRWGKEVYYNPSYVNEWNGENLPAGTYYYDIYHNCSGHHYKGWLHILK